MHLNWSAVVRSEIECMLHNASLLKFRLHQVRKTCYITKPKNDWHCIAKKVPLFCTNKTPYFQKTSSSPHQNHTDVCPQSTISLCRHRPEPPPPTSPFEKKNADKIWSLGAFSEPLQESQCAAIITLVSLAQIDSGSLFVLSITATRILRQLERSEIYMVAVPACGAQMITEIHSMHSCTHPLVETRMFTYPIIYRVSQITRILLKSNVITKHSLRVSLYCFFSHLEVSRTLTVIQRALSFPTHYYKATSFFF